MLYLLVAVLAFAAGHVHCIWFIRPDIRKLQREIDKLKRGVVINISNEK